MSHTAFFRLITANFTNQHGNIDMTDYTTSEPTQASNNSRNNGEVLSNPTFSLEAEKAVISSMIAKPDIIDDINFLIRDDFYQLMHKEMFSTVVSMYREKSKIDYVTVSESLPLELNDNWTLAYLADMCLRPSPIANVIAHAEIIKEYSTKRDALSLLVDSIDSIHSSKSVASEVIAEASNQLAKLSSSISPQKEISSDLVEQDSNPFGYKDIDLENPHGPLGVLCSDMLSKAHRPLKMSYVHYGLHELAMAAVKGGVTGLGGIKLNLITLLISPSSAGKELGQDHATRMAANLQIEKCLYDKPRSDKDLIQNLVETEGKSIYMIDEAHSLFDGMNSKQAQNYQKAIGAELLTMATKNLYSLSGNHRREFGERFDKKLAESIKRLQRAEDDTKLDEGRRSATISKIEKNIGFLERTIESLESGFKQPIVNMAMASTPQKIDSVVSVDSIESGLMGRALITRCSEDREALKKPKPSDTEVMAEVINSLHSAASSSRKPITADDDAAQLIEDITKHFDQHQYRNHSTLGAVFSRITERVLVLSSIQAITTAKVTKSDVMYALALTMRHIEDCNYLLTQSNAVESGDKEDIQANLRSRILKEINKVGVAMGTLKQKVLKPKMMKKHEEEYKTLGRSAFALGLEELEGAGSIVIDGKTVKRI